MALNPAVLDVVELAYQAVVEPDRWREVVATSAQVFGAEAAVVLTPTTERADDVLSSGLEPAALDLYFSRYRAVNPIQAAIDVRISNQQPLHLVSTLQSWLDQNDYLASEYHNDFARVHGLDECLLLALGGPTLNVLRPRQKGAFDAEERETAEVARRALARAYKLGRELAIARGRDEALAEVLAQAAGALVLTDARGRPQFASPAAEALMAGGDGLITQGGALAGAQSAETRQLLQAIGRAVTDGAGAALTLPRLSGRRPYAVVVAPARAGAGGEGERLALVSISDPEPPAPSAERIGEIFGLTPREAQVVYELVGGADTRTIAARLGLSFHTVRAQLASALAKTDTRRQAELVALVIRATSHGA